MNAKQKRKQRQLDNKAKGEDGLKADGGVAAGQAKEPTAKVSTARKPVPKPKADGKASKKVKKVSA